MEAINDMAKSKKGISSDASILIPTQGERVMILVRRLQRSSGKTIPQIAGMMGYTSTYLPKLYDLERLNQKQINAVCSGLGVSKEIFSDPDFLKKIEEMDLRIKALEQESVSCKSRIKALEEEKAGLLKAIVAMRN